LNGAKRLNGWNDWNWLRYSNELHALSDDVCSSVFDQKMNVIGCHNVIEHTKSKALLRLRVLALNVLNGAKRLNGWNVWNRLQRWCVMCQTYPGRK
jgi:hypothetical protein